MTKLRNELLVALYSDYVEPTAAPPYLQRVPYHQLTKQLRAELGEMGARPAFGPVSHRLTVGSERACAFQQASKWWSCSASSVCPPAHQSALTSTTRL